MKPGEKFVLVARNSLRRSSFGPESVRSCGRTMPSIERHELHEAEEAAARARLAAARRRERLVVAIERRLVVANERAFLAPRLRRARAAFVYFASPSPSGRISFTTLFGCRAASSARCAASMTSYGGATTYARPPGQRGVRGRNEAV